MADTAAQASGSLEWCGSGLGFPDPYASTFKPEAVVSGTSARLTHHQRNRAEIFAQARYLLGKMGHERFSITRLAERCSLTTQSIYNIVGNRTQVLLLAMEDHTRAVLDAAMQCEPDQLPILAINDIYLSISEFRPEFLANATRALFGCEPDVRAGLYLYGSLIREQVLEGMKIEGALVANANSAFIAQQLTLHGCAATHDWLLGFCSVEELRQRNRWGAAALLYRHLAPTLQIKLQPLLDSYDLMPN